MNPPLDSVAASPSFDSLKSLYEAAREQPETLYDVGSVVVAGRRYTVEREHGTVTEQSPDNLSHGQRIWRRLLNACFGEKAKLRRQDEVEVALLMARSNYADTQSPEEAMAIAEMLVTASGRTSPTGSEHLINPPPVVRASDEAAPSAALRSARGLGEEVYRALVAVRHAMFAAEGAAVKAQACVEEAQARVGETATEMDIITKAAHVADGWMKTVDQALRNANRCYKTVNAAVVMAEAEESSVAEVELAVRTVTEALAEISAARVQAQQAAAEATAAADTAQQALDSLGSDKHLWTKF